MGDGCEPGQCLVHALTELSTVHVISYVQSSSSIRTALAKTTFQFLTIRSFLYFFLE